MLTKSVTLKSVSNGYTSALLRFLQKPSPTDHDDKCDEAWQKVNCYLKTHNDTIEYCLLFMFQDKYLIK